MRAKDMLGFDPFDSDDDGGGGAAGAAVAGSAPDDMFGGLSSTDMPLHPMLPSDETSTEDALREVEDFLGHRYMRMSQTDIEAELLVRRLASACAPLACSGRCKRQARPKDNGSVCTSRNVCTRCVLVYRTA